MTNGRMDRERIRDLLVAHALGISSEAEREELAAALRHWPEGRLELAALMRTADVLALTSDQSAAPAIGLEGRIMMRARSERDEGGTRAPRRAARHRRARPRRLRSAIPYGFAAAFAALAIGFGVMAFRDDPEPVGRWLAVQGSSGTDAALAYVTNYQNAPVGLLLRDVPPPPEGSIYRLWHVHADDSVLAGPTFQPDAENSVALALAAPGGGEVVGFAVSVEPNSAGAITTPELPTRDAIRYTIGLE